MWRKTQALDCALADRASATRLIQNILQDQRANDYPPAERLLQDAALGLHRYSPVLKETDDIAPSSLLNRAVLDQLSDQGRWQELRHSTRIDEVMAILGAASLGEKLLEVLTEEMKEQARQAAEAEQQALEQQALAAAWADMAAQGDPNASQKQHAAQEAAQQAMAQAQAAAQNAVQQFQGNADAHRQLRIALREAVEDAQAQQRSMAGWGLGAGSNVKVDPAERLALAEALHRNHKLHQIALQAGRLKNIAFGVQARKMETCVGDVSGIELGKDLTRLIPAEWAKLGHPLLKWDFARRYAQGQLVLLRIRERDKAGLGPMVVAWDESGSMAGQKEINAKALSLAVLAIAQRQHRAWAGVAFSAGEQVRSVVFERPHQEVKPADLVDIASHFYKGGTDFKLALDEARRIIGERAFAKADILFITDGISALKAEYVDELLAWKARTGTRIYSIVVSGGSAASLEAWSDMLVSDEEIFLRPDKFDQAARDVFAYV